MKKLMVLVLAVIAIPMFASVSEARRSMLDEVNATCGTNYSCGLCHIDPKGGGPLTSGGEGYAASGNNACYFCPNDPDCSTCTPTTEICNDGKDNDCDGKTDCNDSDCSGSSYCGGGCTPVKENCTDGKDNDCDALIDCADPNCAKNRACK
jgi:hypothetical protein